MVLGVSLVAFAAATPRASAMHSGDVNGDGKVDVLDIHCVMAAALAGGEGAEHCDLNADGRTDIFDLQLVLASATLGAPPEDAGKTPAKPLARLPLQASSALPQLPARSLSLLAELPPDSASHRALCAQLADFAPSPLRTERFLFTLTPHAPPVFA